MLSFVIDASVTLPWCFADEATDYTRDLLLRVKSGEEVGVPSHWPTEVLNALIKAKRRGRTTNADTTRFLTDLSSYRIHIDRHSGFAHWENLRRLADVHLLTSYDAAYLELSIRSGLPLATLDAALRRSALSEQVVLV